MTKKCNPLANAREALERSVKIRDTTIEQQDKLLEVYRKEIARLEKENLALRNGGSLRADRDLVGCQIWALRNCRWPCDCHAVSSCASSRESLL